MTLFPKSPSGYSVQADLEGKTEMEAVWYLTFPTHLLYPWS